MRSVLTHAAAKEYIRLVKCRADSVECEKAFTEQRRSAALGFSSLRASSCRLAYIGTVAYTPQLVVFASVCSTYQRRHRLTAPICISLSQHPGFRSRPRVLSPHSCCCVTYRTEDTVSGQVLHSSSQCGKSRASRLCSPMSLFTLTL